jgi:hypothetical protein
VQPYSGLWQWPGWRLVLSQIWSQPPGSDLGVLCAPATWHLAYFFSAQGLPDQRLAVARQNGELLHEEGGALVGYMARQHLPSLPASLQLLSLRQTLPSSFWYLLGAKER